MKRQKRLLAVLLLLLAAAVAYAIWATPEQTRIESAGNASGRRGPLPGADGPEGLSGNNHHLALELLQRSVASPVVVERDIFNFKVEPPPPPPKIERPVPPPPPPVPAPVVRQAPPPPVVNFDFLGLLRKGEVPVVFLASGKEIFLVRPGDQFGKQGEYRLVSVTDTRLEIETDPNSPPVIVPLGDPAGGGSDGRTMGQPTDADDFGGRPVAPPAGRPRLPSFKRYGP